MVNISYIDYKSFGRCVEVSNGTIDFVATLDFGPRIIRFGLVGGENEFYEDSDFQISLNSPEFKEKFGSDIGWRIYGGHRLWTSPEGNPRSYYPDNEPVMCVEIPNGVRLTPPPQKWTNLQTEIEITISGDNAVDVTHRLTNVGAWGCEAAIWALSVMAQGGLEVVPQPTLDTGLLHNRILAVWPYTKMNDSRVYWGDKYITLRQDKTADCVLKFGINSQHGYAAYFNHGNMFVKYFPVGGANYPDGGMSFETYTNNLMLEIESLGELRVIAPGECVSHTERWQLFGNVERPAVDDENGIAEILEKFLKI